MLSQSAPLWEESPVELFGRRAVVAAAAVVAAVASWLWLG